MSYQHPIARARGHGSARSGTAHWWHQRVSSLLMVPLTAWLTWAVITLAGSSGAEARAFIGSPVNTGAAVLLMAVLFWHVAIGLQVVWEDYVQPAGLEIALQLITRLVCLLFFLAGALAVLWVAFAA